MAFADCLKLAACCLFGRPRAGMQRAPEGAPVLRVLGLEKHRGGFEVPIARDAGLSLFLPVSLPSEGAF